MNSNLYKKGFVSNLAVLLIFGFLLAVTIVISWIWYSSVNDAIQANLNIPDSAKEISQDYADKYVNIWDVVFLVIFVGLILAGVITVLFIDTHPVFFFFTLLATVALLIVGAALGNAYGAFATQDAVSRYASDFIFLPFIMSNILQILIVVSGVYTVIFFVKSRSTI